MTEADIAKMVDMVINEMHKTAKGSVGIIILALAPIGDKGDMAVTYQSNMPVTNVIAHLELLTTRLKQQVN